MKVSVVICTYNRSILLKSAIDSILSNIYPDFDLTIVDQSENDETKNLVNEYKRGNNRIKYLRSEKGKSRALNLGIKETKGEIIAVTDDDCIVSQNWIEKIVSFFELHPDAAIVFGDIIEKEVDTSKGIMVEPVHHYSKNRKYSGVYSMRKGMGAGANMSIKRCVFEKVGYFDENLGPGSDLGPSEDWDFAYRTLAKGYVIYDTNLVKVQHVSIRYGNEAIKLLKGYQISTTAFLVKNLRCGDFAALLVLIGIIWLKYYWLVLTLRSLSKSTLERKILNRKLIYYSLCIPGLLLYTLIGILKSFQYSVDRDKRLFIKV